MPDHIHIVARVPPGPRRLGDGPADQGNSSKWVNETRGLRRTIRVADGVWGIHRQRVPDRSGPGVCEETRRSTIGRDHSRRSISGSSNVMGFPMTNATSGVDGLMIRGSRPDCEISPRWGSMGVRISYPGICLSTGSRDPGYRDATPPGLDDAGDGGLGQTGSRPGLSRCHPSGVGAESHSFVTVSSRFKSTRATVVQAASSSRSTSSTARGAAGRGPSSRHRRRGRRRARRSGTGRAGGRRRP